MQTINTLRKLAAKNAVTIAAAIASILLLAASPSALSQSIYRGANGSAASPTFSFNSDPDTGAYRVGANSWGVAVGGSVVLTVAASSITAAQPMSITAGTATTDVNALSVTQTWNEGSTAFTAAKVNVTNTTSATTSKLLDLQVGGSSLTSVLYDGTIVLAGAGAIRGPANQLNFNNVANTATLWTIHTTDVSDSSTAGRLANANFLNENAEASPILDLTGTWNTTGTPTAIKLDITDPASNAASLLMDLQVGGASKFSVSKAGTVNAVSYSVGGTAGASGTCASVVVTNGIVTTCTP